VVRTRDGREIAAADIVVDVGGVYDETRNRFDHHQIGGAGTRGNGVPYAAFGLVWKQFGATLAKNADSAMRVDALLVTPIDASDNGIDLATPVDAARPPYTIADAIRAFNPTWLEKDADRDSAFSKAVAFAQEIISREVKRAQALCAGAAQVERAYAASGDKRLVTLDEDFSWKDILAKYPEPLYVVHPQNGTWRLYCVRDNPNLFKNRKDLPETWAGLRDEKLTRVTGVRDAVFCHRNRFMAVAKTREDALALAKLALRANSTSKDTNANSEQ
jgi:uncharacterized UPF0160 family protein